MAANQVVLYFEKQEDALLFTLAASSAMSAESAGQSQRGRRENGTRSLEGQPDHD